jgi:SAM-dependent methyltransferase
MTSTAHVRRTTGPDYLERNRAAWNRWAPYYAPAGKRAWQEPELRWGMWGTLESTLGLLEHAEPGMNAVELGCGTGAVCAWLVRTGLRTVGVDLSPAQLENARLLQREFEVDFRLELGNAEALPYVDGSFDFVLSEYGAGTWCDPYRWVPEAARLLRSGGILVFIVTAPLVMTCTSPTGGGTGERLERPYFDLHRFEFEADGAVEFHLGHGEWFRVLRENGFAVDDLREVRPDPNAAPRFTFVSNAWARSWPSEDVWIARRR